MFLEKLILVVLKIITCGLLDVIDKRKGGEGDGKEASDVAEKK